MHHGERNDNMEIRKLDVSEHQESRRLYEEVFDEDSASFVDYYYTGIIRSMRRRKTERYAPCFI